MIAMPANEYMQRYGASREALGAVVVEARKNGARIPWSYWHDRPLHLDEYLAAPLIDRPDLSLRLRHVRSTASPRSCSRRPSGPATSPIAPCTSPATRAGSRSGTACRLHWPARRHLRGRAQRWPRRLWARAGVAPDEVDLPQVYDGFSPVRVVLARGPRRSARSARRTDSSPTAESTATDPARCRPCRAAARSATGACTGSRRCSSATCSSRGRAGDAPAKRDGRRRVPLVAALRGCGRLHRGIRRERRWTGPSHRRRMVLYMGTAARS